MSADVSSILPLYLRPAIPHVAFNRMQLACMDAWDSNHNMLISAPTGSGKTLCFDLALLRHLHLVLGSSEHRCLPASGLNGKVVFLVPTKSLCTEKGDEWKRRYAFLGLRVEILTGDMHVSGSGSALLNADVILTTAEKWDSLTRNASSRGAPDILSEISLLFIDEIHHVGDSRGGILESVITRMFVTSDHLKRNRSSSHASSMRVIALSATIKNVEEVGRWLRVDPKDIKQFDQSYRPIALEYKVLPYHIRNRWQSSKVYDNHILTVWQKFSDGKPALIFCPSRRQTSTSAASIVNSLERNSSNTVESGNVFTKHLSYEQRKQLQSLAASCSDKALGALLEKGVGFHNADLNTENRRLVERLFRESLLLCLFSTSTLAQGLNLPARLVVIAGTTVYHDGSLQECDKNMLLQMCGRAGRPGLDTKGIAVIMTSNTSARLYQNIEKALPTTLKSQLSATLEGCMNAEIARQFITDIPQAVTFLTNTLYWVQEKERQKAKGRDEQGDLNVLETTTAVEVVKKLVRLGLARFDDDLFGVNSTKAGVVIARYCLSCESLRLLKFEIPGISSPVGALRVLAMSPEVLEGVCVRRAEKRKLNDLNEHIRWPVRGKVKEPLDKVVVLMQIILAGDLASFSLDFSLYNEALRLARSLSRICSCILSLVMETSLKGPYEAIFFIMQACRGLINRCYWDGPTVLRQINGLNSVRIKALSKQSICSIEDLTMADRSVIDQVIGTNTRIREIIQESMATIPKFRAKASAVRNSEDGQVAQIEVHVTLSGLQGGLHSRRWSEDRGFVLIGSHSRGFIGIKGFCFKGNDKHFVFYIPPDTTLSRGKWIDVIIGSLTIVGIDQRIRFPLVEPQDKDRRPPKIHASIKHEQSKLKSDQEHSRCVTNLSVTHGRISKRLVQTTVSQTLSRFGDKKISARIPNKVGGGAGQGEASSTSTEKIVNIDERVDTSPDISPGPSSPLPSGELASHVNPPTHGDAQQTKATPTEEAQSHGYGRFHAFMTSGRTHTSLPCNPLSTAPVSKEELPSRDPYRNPNKSRGRQRCREYDEMLKALF